jgi:hypothetical protein
MDQVTQIQSYDMTGKKVFDLHLNQTANISFSPQISAPGLYTVRIMGEQKMCVTTVFIR